MNSALGVFRRPFLVLAALVLIGGALMLTSPWRARAVSNTWTIDSDFQQGVSQGVTIGNDEVRLSTTTSTFPIMWIANSGESSVSKIDTNTGRELGRYKTFFYGVSGWVGPAPSRTTVDGDGNVYVLNRHFDGRQPLVTKILSTGGIDRNGNGLIDTSSDTNNDGRISGAEIMPLVDSNGNGVVDETEIKDDRVAWAARVGASGNIGRAIAMGTDGNVWVGTFNDSKWYKVSSADGSVLAGPYSMPGVNPYGALVDGNGILWSASLSNRLGRLDTNTGAASVYYHNGQDYGIALGNGKVYQSNLSGYVFSVFDPTTNTFSYPAFAKGYREWTIAVAVASNGDVIVTRQYGGVARFKADGTRIWTSGNQPGTGEARGALIDSNGDIWVNHLNNNNASKFRGSDGAWLGVFPVGSFPYTYSDATGITALSTTSPTGYWTVVYDGVAASDWGTISWTATTPEGTGIEVRARAADTEAALDLQNYQAVDNGVLFEAAGRLLQVQVKFTATRAASDSGLFPALHDINVESRITNQPPTADANGPYTVPEGGSITLNGSGSDPDGDLLTYAWDLDNDGAFETAGENVLFSAADRDGPGHQTVGLKVTDPEGASAIDDSAVKVINVAPKVDAGPDAAIYSGQTFNVIAGFADPGLTDSPWNYTVNWGDGATNSGSTNAQGTGVLLWSHSYLAPGSYNVIVSVTDKDGGVGSDQLVLQVKRLPVRIDIKPGSFPNSINLKQQGNVPVGVFTGTYEGIEFDATTLDRATLTFQDAPDMGIGESPADIDGDGDLDQVFHFDTQLLKLTSDSTEGKLTGVTGTGIYFEGMDSVRIIAKK